MSKSTAEAVRHRQVGNELFAKSRFCEALLSYNHSLCFSQENSEDAALGFANRSAVYKELREYELCLENIELAKANGYPRDKIEKLNKRELECKRLMKSHEKDPDDDPKNFFKLSYPANKKLPCLVDCLELKSNQHGTFVVTNQDLKAGDIIASTEPSFRFPLTRARLHVCCYCEKNSKLNLIPCSRCAKAMYCSKECMEADAKEFHKLQCGVAVNPKMASFLCENDLNVVKMLLHILAQFDGDVNKMRKFFEENKTPKNVFDFDLSDTNDPMYKKNMFLAMITSKSLICASEELKQMMLAKYWVVINEYPWLKSMWDSRKNKKFLDAFLVQLLDASQMRTYVSVYCKTKLNLEEPLSVDEEKMLKESDEWIMNHSAVKLDPYYSMIGHSCFPNVASKNVDNKNFWIVLLPIKAGGTISRSLLGGIIFNEEKEKRQAILKASIKDFKMCTCEGCLKNWPLLVNMPKGLQLSTMYELIHGHSQLLVIKNEHKRNYAKYSLLINSLEDNFPCLESVVSQLQLLPNSYPLALPAPWFNQEN